MADINGKNYAKEFVNIPSEQADIGEYGGKIRIILDEWSGAAAGDDIYFGKIPPGAKILSLSHSGGGTAPTFSHSPLDKIGSSSEDLIITTDGGDGQPTGTAWVEYILE
jgi:hypothetical protein